MAFISRKGKRRPSTPQGTDLGIGGSGPGKGSAPRNCFSSEFRANYDRIKWQRQRGEVFTRTFRKVY